MWRGYLDKSNVAYSSELAQSVPVNYEYLHTSGHCDMESLDWLFSTLSPRAIIPIHTDNPRAFADLFCDKWPILMMQDGETFRAIKDPLDME
ncbi:MBL fold metallo-hydrolase RNA specificity domain-containing protein [Paramuribaculum intestinale]